MSKVQPTALCLLASLSFGLSACGGHDKGSQGTTDNGTVASQSNQADAPKNTRAVTLGLADGPDVCFRAITRHLGAATKVTEVNSFFSSGKEIDADDSEPQGQLKTCSVHYQNPADPRKLLSTSMDMNTGEFLPSSPVEITVTGGDASKFKLDDYLIPLSRVNAAGLAAVMEAKKAEASGIYSRYAWSGVRLESPDSFSNVHMLRLDIEGRLASNDIKDGGYAAVTTDGKTVTHDGLKP